MDKILDRRGEMPDYYNEKHYPSPTQFKAENALKG